MLDLGFHFIGVLVIRHLGIEVFKEWLCLKLGAADALRGVSAILGDEPAITPVDVGSGVLPLHLEDLAGLDIEQWPRERGVELFAHFLVGEVEAIALVGFAAAQSAS